jgi:ribosome-associated toxin RatA of RatAB toxin-antitoxin module
MSLPQNPRLASAGRRSTVGRLLVLVAALLVAGTTPAVAQSSGAERRLVVTEAEGVYSVEVTFAVPQSIEAVLAVLTDYAAIPRFMPQVHTSVVRERSGASALVEQEARARFLTFSKRIHLLLAVDESPSALRFRDVCGRSFRRYEGTWHFERQGDQTVIRYSLSARPAFAVPNFLLQRLLKRDATQMVHGLQAEIARRVQ